MGLFNKLGQQVEQFKQDAEGAAEETENYQCRACDARFHAEYEECPECGSPEVESRTTSE